MWWPSRFTATRRPPRPWSGSEWGWLTSKDAVAVGDDAKYNAGYAEVGYFLTGENNGMSLSKGSWGRPKVNKSVYEGGMGAWQLVAKYDMIDLNDRGMAGGEMNTWILGVNWYLNRFTRVMANYSTSNIKHASLDRDVNSFGLRFQVDW